MNNEIWKPLKEYKGVNYEGIYEVSNMGRIRSLDRVADSDKRNSFFVKGRVLVGNTDKKGYKTLILSKNGNIRIARVNVLVAIVFIRIPKKREVVHHINSNPSDNRLHNLKIITKRKNSSIEKTIKSGLPVGVCLYRKQYKVSILIHGLLKRGSSVHLGYYKDVKKASGAYQTVLSAHKENEIKSIKELDVYLNQYRQSLSLPHITRK